MSGGVVIMTAWIGGALVYSSAWGRAGPPPSDEAWVLFRKGDGTPVNRIPLEARDEVRTTSDVRADLLFNGIGIVRLAEDTRLQVRGFRLQGRRHLSAKLASGHTLVKVSPGAFVAGRLVVRTAAAVITSTAAVMAIRVSTEAVTRVHVLDGTATVSLYIGEDAKGRPLPSPGRDIPAGFWTQVGPGLEPTEPNSAAGPEWSAERSWAETSNIDALWKEAEKAGRPMEQPFKRRPATEPRPDGTGESFPKNEQDLDS
jgi:hypothetical protein